VDPWGGVKRFRKRRATVSETPQIQAPFLTACVARTIQWGPFITPGEIWLLHLSLNPEPTHARAYAGATCPELLGPTRAPPGSANPPPRLRDSVRWPTFCAPVEV